jgi:uncharacterized membrane protein YhaH (DUF805 family)
MHYISLAINNYANFKDRTTRKEYWMFYLSYILLTLGLGIITAILYLPEVLLGLIGLFMLVPSISITTRRLHDVGKSGWWQLISIIPLGFIVLIFFLARESDGENEYS